MVLEVGILPARVRMRVTKTASRSASQDLLPIFRLYLVVALSETLRWSASRCCRGWRIILRSEPYHVEERRVRLRSDL